MFRLDFRIIGVNEERTGQYRCSSNNTLDDFSYSDIIVIELKGGCYYLGVYIT